MGLKPHDVGFLLASLMAGASYRSVLTLGRPNWWLSQRETRRLCPGLEMGEYDTGKFSEPFFRWLGADVVHSLDVSPHDDPSIQHDLNVLYFSSRLYSVVLDAGTIEHVFDTRAAVESALRSVVVGGHFLSIGPADGYPTHGYHQWGRHFWRDVLMANGFTRIHIELHRELCGGTTVYVRALKSAEFIDFHPPLQLGATKPSQVWQHKFSPAAKRFALEYVPGIRMIEQAVSRITRAVRRA